MGRAPRHYIRNSVQEAERFRLRAAVGFLGVALALCGMGTWYFKLQVLDHSDYAKRSEDNRIRQRPEVPARGTIYDRKGRVLAENVPAYRLDVVPAEVGKGTRAEIDGMLASLAKIVALSPEDIARFHEQRRISRSFMPITLRLRITDEEAARFAVDRWRYPGVELVPYLNRRYPYGDLFAHVVGYVARVDKKDAEMLGEAGAAFSHIGKTGIERAYDEALRGRIGYELIETTVDGRIVGTAGRIPAQTGVALRLSVDAELQRAATIAFGELTGSVVAIDPRTGEVLALVSLPSYDPNLFVNGISHADFRRLMDDPARPLFNRNVLGGVAPGSTIKPLVALAGLDSGRRTPEDRTLSTGEFRIPGQARGYRDSHTGGHGWTDLRKSIADSVNTYYYRLALDMGIQTFDAYLSKYGFGAPTGIDLVGESGGILPSPEWKAKNAGKQGPWYPGDTVISSIGQGFWKATPLQLAQAVAALARDGQLRRPHLAVARLDAFDQPWSPIAQPAPQPITDNPDHLRAVQEGMVMTIHGPGGTARAMSIGAPYRMAGKTGTAQVISRRGSASLDPRKLPMHLRHRGLFIGFAPAEDPTIAVVVVVEGGGYGGSSAAPVARKVFDAWLLGKMPEPPAPTPGQPPAQPPAGPDAGAAAEDAAAKGADATGGASPAEPVPPAPVPMLPGFVPAAVQASDDPAAAIAPPPAPAASTPSDGALRGLR